MNERISNELKSEIVPAHEIYLARCSSEGVLRAYLQEQTHLLRSKVLDKLAKHGVTEGAGWAIFTLTGQEEDDSVGSSVMTSMPDKKVLVLYSPYRNSRTIDGHPIPIIRIITNEPFCHLDRETQYLSRDFTLDHEDDVQYFVDAQDMYDFTDESKKKPLSEENPSGRNETLTSLFWVNKDGNLCISRPISYFTEAMGIYLTNPDDGTPIESYPFGLCTSPFDALYALEQGEELFAMIERLDPVLISSSTL
jgi:hypothetical protein